MFTLVLPALLQTTPMALTMPAFNQLLRFGRFQAKACDYGDLLLDYVRPHFDLPENSVYASPLNQQMGMNSIHIQACPISEAEAHTLCQSLNELYQNDCHFTPLRPDVWQCTFAQAIQWQAPPVWQIYGQHDGMQPTLAQGIGQGEWLRLQSELQMWLHNHPINQQRPHAINTIWLWQAPTPRLLAETSALVGSNSAWAQQPIAIANYAEWQHHCQQQQTALEQSILFLDDLQLAQQNNDLLQYQTLLEQWDKDYFAPIWADLRTGKLKQFRIITNGEQGGELMLNSFARFAFWKKKRQFDGTKLALA